MGSRFRCKGCWNVETWQSGIGKNYTLDELIESINQSGEIEGVTILGGEPLQQKLPVLRLIEHVKSLGLTVMLTRDMFQRSLMKLCGNATIVRYCNHRKICRIMRDLGHLARFYKSKIGISNREI